MADFLAKILRIQGKPKQNIYKVKGGLNDSTALGHMLLQSAHRWQTISAEGYPHALNFRHRLRSVYFMWSIGECKYLCYKVL